MKSVNKIPDRNSGSSIALSFSLSLFYNAQNRLITQSNFSPSHYFTKAKEGLCISFGSCWEYSEGLTFCQSFCNSLEELLLRGVKRENKRKYSGFLN